MDNAVDIARDTIAARQNEIIEQRNKIAEAEANVVRLQREMAFLETWVETWHQLTGTVLPTATATRREDVPSPPPRTRRPKNADRELVVERAIKAIIAYEKPMNRHDLFNWLTKVEGLEIHGKDPEMVLSTMLWRSKDKIVRLPNYGYWPTEMDHIPSGYIGNGADFLGVAAEGPEGDQIADDAE